MQNLLEVKKLIKDQLILSVENCQTVEQLKAIANLNKIVIPTTKSAERIDDDDDLNEGQAIAIQALKDFINSDDQWFRLSGYAGTGKSFTLARFVQWAITKKIRFCVASPTHKALKNIKRMLAAIGLREGADYQAVTLAKLLGRVADVDTESGKQLFITRDDFDGIKNFDLIIIDEYSMVGQKTFDDICQECEPYTQIVAVGDPGQLPPVGEDISPIAVLDCPSATLTEIVRYDGEIVAVAEAIRTDPQYQTCLYQFHSSDDQTIRVIPPEPIWLDQAVELFKSSEWEENPDYCRAIAWRNSTVAGFNRAIRQRIHGKDVPDFIVGDRLVARAPITRLGVLGWTIVADNREEFVVVCEPMAIADDETDWEYYSITAKSETGLIHHLRILTPASEKLRDKRKKELAKEAKALKAKGDDKYRDKWRLFYDLGRSFDNVTHALCMTAHSAQGSTIDNVFLYAKEMRFCSEKQQILYTSLTRAKSACFICQ